MEITNQFKRRLKKGEVQYGIWNALVDTMVAEILAGSGFDWILIDAEHGPFDLRTIQAQLQAIQPYGIPVVVRPPGKDGTMIKRLMDIGVQNLLIPMVQSAEEAEQCGQFMKYPPEGVRGVGSSLARAAKWDRIPDYLAKANDEMCLIVQVEHIEAVHKIDEIINADHVDAVFIGPADLAASMGHLGNSKHPDVVRTIEECLDKIEKSTKKSGILAGTKELNASYAKKGVSLIGSAQDTMILSQGAMSMAKYYKSL